MIGLVFDGGDAVGERHARRVDPLERRLRYGVGSKLAAEVIGRALQFWLIYSAQRALGPATYGEFTYALAIGVVLAPLTDLGIQLMVTREMARNPARVASVTGTGLMLKIVLACAITGAIAILSLTRQSDVRVATFMIGVALILGSFGEFFGYALRGLHRVDHEALLTFVARGVTVALGLTALSSGLGLNGLAVAYVVGGGLSAVAGYVWLRTHFFAPRLAVDLAASGSLLRQSLPLGGAIVLSMAFTRTPIFLLDALWGSVAVGLYGVAQKLTEPLAMIPAAFMAAVFPAFSQGLSEDADRARALGARSMRLLGLAGGAIALGSVLAGPRLIDWLYAGQYAGAERSVQVLGVAVLLTFLNYGLTHFLIAMNRQALNLLFTGVIFVFNVGACLILIPRFGPAGAAASVLLSEGLLLLLCRRTLRDHALQSTAADQSVSHEPS